MIKFWRYCWILLCSLVLVACAGPGKNLSGQSGDFLRTGRFAINYQSSLEKPYAAQGGFQWWDNGNTLTISLSNPMGSTLAQVKITNDYSTLTYSDGRTQSANTPDELLAMIWGHEIPVSGLRYWIRGDVYPDAALTDVQRSQGQLTSFKQLGWQLDLSDYDDQGPKKIRLVRAEQQSRLNLRFMIN